MPELQEFHDDHSDRDAVVIGINIEQISKLQLQGAINALQEQQFQHNQQVALVRLVAT